VTEVRVRPAAAAETGLILQFILDLADYEKMTDAVKIGEDDVRSLLFAPAPRAFCDIAELDGAPVGFAFWFYNVSTFEGRCGIHLEDIYVRPSARGAGAGKALMANLARRCMAEGLTRIEWAVLDWNAPAIAFYDSLGASAKTEWITRRLAGAALEALAASR
jgi:GNAT superfamily N-acetyltransferase